MKVNDPLRLNDWKMKDFLLAILAVQSLFLATIGLNAFGIDTLFLRQIVGFICLVFVPGIVLLRILKLHNLSVIETLLYSVGLSIAFLMLLGLMMNVLYPIAGISEPLTTTHLVLTASVAVLFLCVLGYFRDKDFSNPNLLDTKDLLSPTVLALCLLPLLSVLGTYFVNFHDDNTLLLILLVIVSIMPILAMFDRFPKKLYALTILVIALSLLLHYSLISMYLTGWDIQTEYYFANLVKSKSYWVASIPNDYNAMLSVVMLAPILSNMCDMSIVWVFKIIYPLLFSLVPLALYKIFQKQTDEKTAFLSCFLFMAISTFYTEMLALARQQIGEMFQVLILLLIIEGSLSKTKKSILGIVFAFSLITSHYALSYIFLFCVIFIWGFLTFAKRQASGKGMLKSHTFVFLFVTLVLTWYLYVSASSVLSHGILIGNNIIRNIFDLFNPRTAQALRLIVTQARAPLHEITRYMYLFISFSISAGILALLLKRIETKLQLEYKLLSIINIAMLLAGIALPYFSGALNTSRIYQVALLLLAPFFVIGCKTILDVVGKGVKRSWKNRGLFLKMLAVFLAIFFLFDSGFIYQIAKNNPTSISLDKSLSFPIFNEQEVITAEWLRDEVNTSIPVYSDLYRDVLLSGIFGERHYFTGDTEITTSIRNQTYFFLGSVNVKSGQMVIISPNRTTLSPPFLQNMTFYNKTFLRSNKIYDNDGAQAYYYPTIGP